MNGISPGIVGMYRRLGSFGAATLFSLTARAFKRAGHRATARCYCGTCAR